MPQILDNTAHLETLLNNINNLPNGGSTPADPVLQEKVITPATSVLNVTADAGYDGLSKVTVNAMPTATQATPSISVSSGGLITASSTQSAGYVASGTKSATKQLTTQAAKIVTPSTSSQTAVASGVYTTGAVTVAGDANLIPANIASGVSIFGVAGAHEGGSGGSSSGGYEIITGQYTPSSQTEFDNSTGVTINVGFKPKAVFFMHDYSNGSNTTVNKNYLCYALYIPELSMFRAYTYRRTSSGGVFTNRYTAVPPTVTTVAMNITSTGFRIYKYNSSGNLYCHTQQYTYYVIK